MTPELVRGSTFHKRLEGSGNAFRYAVDYVLLEPEADVSCPAFFSRNRFNLAAIHDRDHGGERQKGSGTHWVRKTLKDRGLGQLAKARVLLLAQPRMLGHWFNPVAFWLVVDDHDALRAVIAEVNNTYGDRHSYICHRDDLEPIGPLDELRADKIFHVSPFLPIAGTYTFRFDLRDDRIGICITLKHDNDGGGGLLATLTGKREALTSKSLLASLFKRPVGSLRVLALIHLQAIKLKLSGAQFRGRPTPPATEVS